MIYKLVLGMKVKPCINPQDGGQGLILISLGFMSGIVTMSKELNVTHIKQGES